MASPEVDLRQGTATRLGSGGGGSQLGKLAELLGDDGGAAAAGREPSGGASGDGGGAAAGWGPGGRATVDLAAGSRRSDRTMD